MTIESADELAFGLVKVLDPASYYNEQHADLVKLITARDNAVANAARVALLQEIEDEALREYRDQVGPGEWNNAQKLGVAAGTFRMTLNNMKAKYAPKAGG